MRRRKVTSVDFLTTSASAFSSFDASMIATERVRTPASAAFSATIATRRGWPSLPRPSSARASPATAAETSTSSAFSIAALRSPSSGSCAATSDRTSASTMRLTAMRRTRASLSLRAIVAEQRASSSSSGAHRFGADLRDSNVSTWA